MSLSNNIPKPIIDNLDYLGNSFQQTNFSTAAFFSGEQSVPGSEVDLEFALKFLISYNGSTATFNSYRREIERLLQWAWFIHCRSVVTLKREDIEQYISFCQSPPLHWIGIKNVARFQYRQGSRVANPAWRPFVHTVTKQEHQLGHHVNPKAFTLSQAAIKAVFAILSSFFNYLVQESCIENNPVALIRQKNKYIKTQQYQAPVRRISNLQWEYVLDVVANKANDMPEKYERSLFIVHALYCMYLRISELVADERSLPVMGDFRKDMDGHWWFHVTGKGNKDRIIAVSDAMLNALKRYRRYRQLAPLPSIGESTVLIPKSSGFGPITSTRAIRNLVQQCFDDAYTCMQNDGLEDDAQELRAATVHWLRHTGISEDVKVRPREHVRDDAGHASMQTTDRYIESDLRERHASSQKKRLTS